MADVDKPDSEADDGSRRGVYLTYYRVEMERAGRTPHDAGEDSPRTDVEVWLLTSYKRLLLWALTPRSGYSFYQSSLDSHMPIETSSDAWQSATEPPTAEEIVTDFLRNNPHKAFTLRELANKTDMADWDSALERFEDKEKMDSEDFYDQYLTKHSRLAVSEA
jgi:hypothetical protein